RRPGAPHEPFDADTEAGGILRAETRKAYYDRFVFSKKFAQVDPWSERVSGKDKQEFKPMATVGYPQAAE
ncbi:hypothetical protein ACCS81_38175, partial [Rhizobium ruizarguesonis]